MESVSALRFAGELGAASYRKVGWRRTFSFRSFCIKDYCSFLPSSVASITDQSSNRVREGPVGLHELRTRVREGHVGPKEDQHTHSRVPFY
jgi:hypothetical protein